MENPWTSLTPRHKKYAMLAMAGCTVMGLVAGMLVAFLSWLGLTTFGLIVTPKKELTGDDKYQMWMGISFTAIICGLLGFVGAIIGLGLHQAGTI